MTTTLKIKQLRRDGGTQSRAALDLTLIEEYRQLIEDSYTDPSIKVGYPFNDPMRAIYDGSEYWLVDGFHRAAALLGYFGDDAEGLVNVSPGTQADAQWASYGVNRAHGLRRSNADKRRSVIGALKGDAPSGKKGYQMSDREIARHTGVDSKTVGNIRHELETSREIPQSDARIGGDGREIDSSGIGANGRTSAAAWTMPQDWHESIFLPWQEKYDGEIPAIKRGDWYLVLDPPRELILYFDLKTRDVYPLGNWKGLPITTLYLDEKMLEVCMKEFALFVVHELHEPMARLVSAIIKYQIAENKFELRSFEVKPGDFVGVRNGSSVIRVDEVDESCIRTRYASGLSRAVGNRDIQSIAELNHNKKTIRTVWESLPGATWSERWQAAKSVYARDAILACLIRNEFLVSFGDDADAMSDALVGDVVWIAPDVVLSSVAYVNNVEDQFKKGIGAVVYRDSTNELIEHVSQLMKDKRVDLHTVSALSTYLIHSMKLSQVLAEVQDADLRNRLLDSLRQQETIIRQSPVGAFVPVQFQLFIDANNGANEGDQILASILGEDE